MEYFSLALAVLITIIFYVYKKDKFVWWEFFAPTLGVFVFNIICIQIYKYNKTNSEEYWGSYVTNIYEEEPYNYWHSETCSYTTTDSKGNTTTHYYDCSHQEDVSPNWYAKTSLNEKINISERQYDELKKQFGTKPRIVDKHKNYSPNDRGTGTRGTKFEGKRVGQYSYEYEVRWDGSDNTRKSYTSVHTYKNKIKASDLSVFNISLVTEDEADTLGLYKYPDYRGGISMLGIGSSTGLEYPTILGDNISKETQEKFKRLNGKYGASNKLRLWVLVFDDKPLSIAKLQENYWVRGNMNELVICIGRSGNVIEWADVFSWSKSTTLTASIKNEILELFEYKDSTYTIQGITPTPITNIVNGKETKTVKVKKYSNPVLTEKTWGDLYEYLDSNLSSFEIRRIDDEMDYIKIELSKGFKITIYIFAFLISIGFNLWVVNNDIED